MPIYGKGSESVKIKGSSINYFLQRFSFRYTRVGGLAERHRIGGWLRFEQAVLAAGHISQSAGLAGQSEFSFGYQSHGRAVLSGPAEFLPKNQEPAGETVRVLGSGSGKA